MFYVTRVWSHYYTISKTRTLIIETQSDSDQDDLEEIVHDPEGDIWKDKLVVDQTTTLGCLSSMHQPSIDYAGEYTCRFSVGRCALAQPKKSDDSRRSTIFQTLTKISDKNYRVIINSGSYANVGASNMVTKFLLKVVPHPQPYKVPKVNSVSIALKDDVSSRSNFPLIWIKFDVM